MTRMGRASSCKRETFVIAARIAQFWLLYPLLHRAQVLFGGMLQLGSAEKLQQPLPYCSRNMTGRGIPSLRTSVRQSFGLEVDFDGDVQVLLAQVSLITHPECSIAYSNTLMF